MRSFAWVYKDFQGSTFDADGPWSLGHIYDRMLKEGLLDVFFYDGRPQRAWFEGLNFGMTDIVSAAYDGETLLGFARINNITARSGMMHFCYFDAGKDIAPAIAEDLFDDLVRGGFKSLMGLTPKPYRHAIRFAESVGFVRCGVLPGACKLANHGGRIVDGIITVKTLTQGD